MSITLKLAQTNPNFNKNDNHRPMFYNADVKAGTKTITEVKDAWLKTIFGDKAPVDASSTWKEPTFMKASVQYPVADGQLEKIKSASYVLINRDGFKKLYFIDSVIYQNNGSVLFNMTLDVITTYLDSLKYGKYAKIERRHFDRFIKNADGQWIRNMSNDSAIWNVENAIKVSPSNPMDFLQLDFKNAVDKTGVLEYYKYFGFNDDSTLIWGLYEPDSDDTYFVSGSDNNKGLMPYGKIVLPIFGSNQFNGDTDSVQFTYHNHDFRQSNAIAVREVIGSPKLTALVSTILPIIKFWEVPDVPPIGPPFIADFNLTQAITIKSSRVTNPFEAKYDVITKNPIYKKIDTTSINKITKLDASYESKLFTSQFLDINFMDFKNQKKKLINKYLDPSKENIDYTFAERITGTEQKTIINIKNGLYENAKNGLNRLVFSDFEQIPSKSSPFLNFENNHLQSYKTGIQNNQIRGTVGVATGLAAAAFNPLAALGAGASGLDAVLKQRSMNAQVEDTKQQATSAVGESTSAINDYDFIASELFDKTIIPFGLEMFNLSKFQETAINLYFAKYGYETDQTEKIEKYDSLATRANFSFWQAPKFSNAIDKTNVNNQVIQEINRIFALGITLWNVETTGNVDINNYENENWELDLYEELQ